MTEVTEKNIPCILNFRVSVIIPWFRGSNPTVTEVDEIDIEPNIICGKAG